MVPEAVRVCRAALPRSARRTVCQHEAESVKSPRRMCANLGREATVVRQN